MLRPVLQFDAKILLKAQGENAQGPRVVFFDIDGVLTDGSLHYTATGEDIKVFNVQDGFGLKLLREAGIEPVIITGRDSAPLRTRLAGLDIHYAYYGVKDKLKVAMKVLEVFDIGWDQAAAIGDDWPDLPVLSRVSFAVAPANAHVEVQALAHYVTQARGGHGAVREFCDILLMAAASYDKLYHQWLGTEE